MDLITILTIIALILNVVALCAVAYQTHLNRKALILAKESIDEGRKDRQIEMLPRAGLVLEARYLLNKWYADLEKLKIEIQQAQKSQIDSSLKKISEKAIKTPKGLVSKSFYENAPRWIIEIVLTGAQYYYDCHAPMKNLWLTKEQKPFWSLALDLLERFNESLARIIELLSYIDHIVPEAYAHAPASLMDYDFLD